MRESIKLGLILMLIAGCAAGALAVVNYYTEPLIQKQQQKQQEDATQKSLLEVLPENSGGAFVLSNELKELAPAEIRSLFGDVYVANPVLMEKLLVWPSM